MTGVEGDIGEQVPGRAATFGAALALLAFALAGLAVGTLLISEVYIARAVRPWLLAGACALGAAPAMVLLLRVCPPIWLNRPTALLAASPGPKRGNLKQRVVAHLSAAPLRAAATAVGIVAAIVSLVTLNAIGDTQPVRHYWPVFWIWQASIVFYCLGQLAPDRIPSAATLSAQLRRNRTPWIDAAALLVLALVLRVLWLTQVPDITTGDEGVFGLAATWMTWGEGGHMFGTYWANGMLYLVPHAWLLQLGVPPALAIRLPTAVAGAFAAPATYALGRTFDRRVGLVAGLWLATSHLHVHVSRMGLGHGLDALWAALAAWGLLGGMRDGNRTRAVIGGLALGAAQYGYVGGRAIDLAALAFVLAAGAWLVGDRLRARFRAADSGSSSGASLQRARLAIRPLVVAFGASVIVAAPMIRWALVRPGDYLSRVNSTGAAQTGGMGQAYAAAGGDFAAGLRVAAVQAGDALLAFIGAPADQFYFAEFPMLDVTWSALFLLGIVVALARPRDLRLSFSLWIVVVAMLVLGLSTHSATSAYRITFVLPAVAVLAAVALWLLVEGSLAPVQGRLPALVGAVVAIAVAAFQTWAYAGVFAQSCDYFDINTARASILGRDLAAAPSGTHAFVLGEPDFDPRVFDSVHFLSGRRVLRLPQLMEGDPQPGSEGSAEVMFSLPRNPMLPEMATLSLVGEAPVRVYLVDAGVKDMEAVKRLLPGGQLRSLRRCDYLAFDVWERP